MQRLVRAVSPRVWILDSGNQDLGRREQVHKGGNEGNRPADAHLDRGCAPGVRHCRFRFGDGPTRGIDQEAIALIDIGDINFGPERRVLAKMTL